MLERGEPVEGVNRAEPRVAGPRTVAAFVFEVAEERADQRRVQVVDVQLEWLLTSLVVREAQQQPERVAVGGDSLRAGIALGDQRPAKNACSTGAIAVMTGSRETVPGAG